jgi:hypothetical protein
MELASMLAGERFSDRPASVCPIIGALLRAYNDNLDERRRADLYRYAAEAVGTRGGYDLQRRRAEVALAWARSGYENRRKRLPLLTKAPAEPDAGSGPDVVAYHVVGSLAPSGRRRSRQGRWSDSAHNEMLRLIDRLIEIGFQAVQTPFPAQPQPAITRENVFEPAASPVYALSIASM